MNTTENTFVKKEPKPEPKKPIKEVKDKENNEEKPK